MMFDEFKSDVYDEPELEITANGDCGPKDEIDHWDASSIDIDGKYNDKRLLKIQERCKAMLFPPHPEVNLPTSFVFGLAIGNQTGPRFVFAPTIGINSGIAIPIFRPKPQLIQVKNHHAFKLSESRFYANILIAANVSVTSLIFPGENSTNKAINELSWILGGYAAVEVGGITFKPNGAPKIRIAFTFGYLFAYLGGSSQTSNTFLFGVQPGLIAYFAP